MIARLLRDKLARGEPITIYNFVIDTIIIVIIINNNNNNNNTSSNTRSNRRLNSAFEYW